MKALLILLYCLPSFAFDSDQKPSECGQYQVFAQIICRTLDACELVVGESKQSKIVVKLVSSTHGLSYFSGLHTIMDIELLKIEGAVLEGRALGTPVQQFGAIKKAGMKLKKAGICK